MNTISDFHGENFFLSNFYEHPFYYNGLQWKTVEHAFQAAKCLRTDEYDKIHAAKTPGEAKRLGRKVSLRPDWDEARNDVMRECLLMKFLTNPELLEKLCATKDALLIEGNTWNDRYWGQVRDAQGQWNGQNMLGKLLMEIRDNYLAGNYCWVAVDAFEEKKPRILKVFKNLDDAKSFIAKQTARMITHNHTTPFEAGCFRITPILYG